MLLAIIALGASTVSSPGSFHSVLPDLAQEFLTSTLGNNTIVITTLQMRKLNPEREYNFPRLTQLVNGETGLWT